MEIGCAGYNYNPNQASCTLWMVIAVDEVFVGGSYDKTGKVSSQCPLGQVRGPDGWYEPKEPVNVYGMGLCQN